MFSECVSDVYEYMWVSKCDRDHFADPFLKAFCIPATGHKVLCPPAVMTFWSNGAGQRCWLATETMDDVALVQGRCATTQAAKTRHKHLRNGDSKHQSYAVWLDGQNQGRRHLLSQTLFCQLIRHFREDGLLFQEHKINWASREDDNLCGAHVSKMRFVSECKNQMSSVSRQSTARISTNLKNTLVYFKTHYFLKIVCDWMDCL